MHIKKYEKSSKHEKDVMHISANSPKMGLFNSSLSRIYPRLSGNSSALTSLLLLGGFPDAGMCVNPIL